METSEGAIFYVKAGFDEAMLKWMMERETGSINESMADDLLEFYVKIRNFL